jgi:ketosteroid isomerase-like protein
MGDRSFAKVLPGRTDMPIARQRIEIFFSEYAEALASRDAKAIARHWGVPGLVLSDFGAQPIASVGEIEGFFASSMEQYEGIAGAEAEIEHVADLADTVAACEITWRHKDENGSTIGGEAGHYMLKDDGEALRIHVYTPKPE